MLCLFLSGCSAPDSIISTPIVVVRPTAKTVTNSAKISRNAQGYNQIWFSTYQNDSMKFQYLSTTCIQDVESCPKQITNFPMQFSQSMVSPIFWSPDGAKFAFMIEANDSLDIYIADANELSGKNVTNSAERETFLSWSSDGNHILYEKEVILDQGTQTQIWIAKDDGSNAHEIAIGCCAQWSTDGEIYYLLQNPLLNGNDLYVINPSILGNGKKITNTSDIQEFRVSPDGITIAITKIVNNITILCLLQNGNFNHPLCHNSVPDNPSNIVWSPKSDKIVFTSQLNNMTPPDIYLLDIASNTFSNLSNSPDYSDQSPSWLPDGSKVIFTSSMEDGQTNIYIVNIDGSGLARITNATNDLEYLYGVWRP